MLESSLDITLPLNAPKSCLPNNSMVMLGKRVDHKSMATIWTRTNEFSSQWGVRDTDKVTAASLPCPQFWDRNPQPVNFDTATKATPCRGLRTAPGTAGCSIQNELQVQHALWCWLTIDLAVLFQLHRFQKQLVSFLSILCRTNQQVGGVRGWRKPLSCL